MEAITNKLPPASIRTQIAKAQQLLQQKQQQQQEHGFDL